MMLLLLMMMKWRIFSTKSHAGVESFWEGGGSQEYLPGNQMDRRRVITNCQVNC